MPRPLARHEIEFILTAKDLTKKSFRGVGKSLPALGAAARVAGAAFAVMGVAAIAATKHYADFQTELVSLGKVTEQDINKIKKKILELPPELGRSTDLVKGLYQTISAGITDPIKSFDALKVAAMAAKAAHLDLGTTVSGLTNVMDGFKGKIDSVSDASDLLFTIERVGKTQFEAIAPVIGQVATASNELGLSLDEMGGLFATVTKTAGGTEIAATQVKAAINALLKPSTDMTRVLKDIGFATGKAAVEQLGFTKALKAIIEESKKTDTSLSKLFANTRGFLAIAPSVKDGFETMSDNIGEMGKRTGATEKAFSAFSGTIQGKVDALTAQFGKMSIEMVDLFAVDIVDALSFSLEAVVDFARGIKGMGTETQTFSNDAGLAFAFVGEGVADFIEGLVTGGARHNSILGEMGIAWYNFGTSAINATTSAWEAYLYVFSPMIKATDDGVNAIRAGWDRLWEEIPKKTAEVFVKVDHAYLMGMIKAADTMKAEGLKGIKKATSAIEVEAKKGGEKITRGLADGMTETKSLSWVKKGGEKITKSVADIFKSSQSASYLNAAGERIPLDISKGMTSSNSITVLGGATGTVIESLEGLVSSAGRVGTDAGLGLLGTFSTAVKTDPLPRRTTKELMLDVSLAMSEEAKKGGESSGKALTDALAEQTQKGTPKVKAATRQMLVDGVDVMMAHSDAKEGPLSRLTASGRAIAATLANGITLGTASLRQATAAAMDQVILEIKRVTAAIASVPGIEIPTDAAEQNIKALKVSIASLRGKEIKIKVNLGNSIDDVKHLKSTIDSIPSVTTKKLIYKVVTEASPQMPFTEGMNMIEARIANSGGVRPIIYKVAGLPGEEGLRGFPAKQKIAPVRALQPQRYKGAGFDSAGNFNGLAYSNDAARAGDTGPRETNRIRRMKDSAGNFNGIILGAGGSAADTGPRTTKQEIAINVNVNVAPELTGKNAIPFAPDAANTKFAIPQLAKQIADEIADQIQRGQSLIPRALAGAR